MDFNSNDEYLKAFPPNFGPKLEGRHMLNQLMEPDFEVQKAPPNNQQDNIEETNMMKQMPKPACLYEELLLEAQEPIQVHVPAYNAENKGDEMLKAQEFIPLCQEDLAPARDESNLAQPEIIIEPTPQVVDTTPVMEVQRDNELVLGESDGEPCVETAISLGVSETRVIDGETLCDTQVDGPLSTIEITQETTIHCEVPADTIGVIKDSILALDDVGHYEAEIEKSGLEEAIEVATMKEETLGLPLLREFVEGTRKFLEQEKPITDIDTERPVTDIDTVEGNTMDTEPSQDVRNGQPADPVGQTKFAEETITTRIGTSENADAIAAIENKEPFTLETIKKTTVRVTYETQTSQNELPEHTQRDSEVLGTEDATMAFEITEKTTVKAKAVCPFEGEEEAPFASDGVPSASLGLEDLGTCSDADVDKIVDSIMNDIADIEADMEVESEADMESNTQQPKLEICGKSIGMESTAICQDYIQSMGSHV